ncbi:primosomal protein N' [Patescibacteria group bacterium]|nr:primosomal protein N' [Patescibacteria group bacterium]
MPRQLATLVYEVPESLKETIKIGSYVNIPLRNKFEEGIVLDVSKKEPSYQTKEIIGNIFDQPILDKWQIDLMNWIATYYKAPVWNVIQLFLPPKIYPESEIKKFEDKYDEKNKHFALNEKFKLTKDQKNAFEKILNTKKVSLLHGITGSGKTEIYLHLVEKYMNEGKQSILVVPEISLTPQMIKYFQRIFGEKVAILHSKLTAKKRSIEWLKIKHNLAPIIIGPRSAIFAPTKNLGLIILDEEHEFSYKQDQIPRYHALDVIKKIAELKGDVKIVLGSATPSVESYYKAKNKEYELIELNQRIGTANLPQVHVVDLRLEFQKGNYSVLSDLMQDKITQTLANKKQVILFLNKRGSASAIVCRECGYIEKCPGCDVPMTYHKLLPQSTSHKPSLICHHCGLIKEVPIHCPTCESVSIKHVGAGTQRVEEEVHKLFPNARVARVDKDTTAKRGSFEEIYGKFKKGELDILIGTQMIGKGLHFPNVDLVGVILADIGLHFPDFQSSQRTFQLLTQVAGRAGRDKTAGEVVFQTYMPTNAAIEFAKNHDYRNFYEYEIKQRATFQYPPFENLVKMSFVHKNVKIAEEEARETYEKLKEILPESYKLNIYPALMFKLNNKYRWNLLIQGENPSKFLDQIVLTENCRVDVDPISVS